MKNVIIIDIDSDRELPIIIGKPEDTVKAPSNADEAREMINNDIVCLREALLTLIYTADASGYGKSSELIEQSIKHLNTEVK